MVGLGHWETLERLIEWFSEVCFDPEREEREGAARRYRWHYGDQIDPAEVLQTSFPYLSQSVIRRAVEQLGNRSSNWRLRPDELGPDELTHLEQQTTDRESPLSEPVEASTPLAGAFRTLRDDVLDRLDRLEEALAEFEPPPNLGHNQPPEPIEDAPWSRQEFLEVREAIFALRDQATATGPDRQAIGVHKSKLQEFGQRLMRWSQERLTKFSDSVLGAPGKTIGAGLGAVAVFNVTNLIPHVFNAVQSITRFLHAIP